MPTAVATSVIIVLFAGVYFLWRFLLQKSMRTVVSVFRRHKATDPSRAATLEALGLERPKSRFGTFLRLRSHRQTVMLALAEDGIIKASEGARFYLSEDALDKSRLKQFAGIR